MLPSPLAFKFPNIRVFSHELTLCIRWPKYWRLSFSKYSPNEYSGLISFSIDCFDLLAAHEGLLNVLVKSVCIFWLNIFPRFSSTLRIKSTLFNMTFRSDFCLFLLPFSLHATLYTLNSMSCLSELPAAP